ncbi:hypothetical protein [Kribbella sp. NPDC055071]
MEYILHKPRWSDFYQTLLLGRLRTLLCRPMGTCVVAGCNYPGRLSLIDAAERDVRAVAVQDAIPVDPPPPRSPT